jgi:diaminopimelate decarboxylase
MRTKHENMTQFQQSNNEIYVAGKTLAQIESLVGRTPFYVYERNALHAKISNLTNNLPKKIKLHYAIKANPYPPLVHFMKPLVDGFDVASKKEMLLAIQTGMPVEEISFAGPGKTEEDIKASIVAGITLHAESTTEIARAIRLGKQLCIKPNIAIRVNPAFELKASGMKMAGGSKPFGIDEEQLPTLLKELDYHTLNFKGFHIFAGSQNLNIDAIIDMHQKTFELASQLIKLTPVKIDYINIGGGLGIPYFPGDKRLDLAPICENLAQLVERYTSLENIELIMELGRYLVGEAGLYVAKVVDKKISRDTTYLVCDGGLHHHLSNSGNFGQVIRKNYPVDIGNKLNGDDDTFEKVNIVGPLCTPLDILANAVELPIAQIDDYVVVYQSGAYGATASPQDFLSQPSLSEILL